MVLFRALTKLRPLQSMEKTRLSYGDAASMFLPLNSHLMMSATPNLIPAMLAYL
jgi:hypothetical protein